MFPLASSMSPLTNAKPTAPPANGPGGVGSAFVWFKADAGVTNSGDGTDATAWADQSGNGYNAFLNGGPPTYYSSGGPNGLPGLAFDIVNGQNFTFTSPSIGEARTLFIVVSQGSSDADDSGFANAFTIIGGVSCILKADPQKFGVLRSEQYICGDISAADDSFHILEIVETDASVFLLYVDGVLSNRDDGGSGTYTEFTFGNTIIGGDEFGEGMTGTIAEIVVYARTLNSSDRSAVRHALGTKYAISVI